MVDKRQSLHFEQVFEVAENWACPRRQNCSTSVSARLTALTANRSKSRDGGVMNLEDMIKISKDKVRESMPEPSAEYEAAYIEKLVGRLPSAQ